MKSAIWFQSMGANNDDSESHFSSYIYARYYSVDESTYVKPTYDIPIYSSKGAINMTETIFNELTE